MIKVNDWGFTNPIVSDLYGKPPLVWKDMDIHLVVYETDPENIEKVIPEPLRPRTNLVIVWQSHFDLGTTQGAFSETAIYVQVEYNGIKGDYEPFLYVNSPLPLTAGREIWGYQKKMAQMDWAHDMEAVRWQTNRLGHEIVKALVVPRYEAKMDEIPWSPDGVFSLKYIPCVEEGGEPIRQLILTRANSPRRKGKSSAARRTVSLNAAKSIRPNLRNQRKFTADFLGKATSTSRRARSFTTTSNPFPMGSRALTNDRRLLPGHGPLRMQRRRKSRRRSACQKSPVNRFMQKWKSSQMNPSKPAAYAVVSTRFMQHDRVRCIRFGLPT
jgi:hypothetical protein